MNQVPRDAGVHAPLQRGPHSIGISHCATGPGLSLRRSCEPSSTDVCWQAPSLTLVSNRTSATLRFAAILSGFLLLAAACGGGGSKSDAGQTTSSVSTTFETTSTAVTAVVPTGSSSSGSTSTTKTSIIATTVTVAATPSSSSTVPPSSSTNSTIPPISPTGVKLTSLEPVRYSCTNSNSKVGKGTAIVNTVNYSDSLFFSLDYNYKVVESCEWEYTISRKFSTLTGSFGVADYSTDAGTKAKIDILADGQPAQPTLVASLGEVVSIKVAIPNALRLIVRLSNQDGRAGTVVLGNPQLN